MRTHRWLGVLLVFVVFMVGAVCWSSRFLLGLNVTPSLPGHVYVIDKADRTIERDSLIAFRWTGERPIPHGMTVIKIVKGLPGDLLTVRDRDIYLNGRFLAWAKPTSMSGTPLAVTVSGVIPEGYVFVYAPHPDSYDSRYAALGLVPTTAVIGRAKEWF